MHLTASETGTTMIDITSIGLNAFIVFQDGRTGHVIKCTEKPSITVQFENGKRVVITEANVNIIQCVEE